MAAAGYYVMAKDQLERFREAVVDPVAGPEVATLADDLTGSGYQIGAHETLKTAPRGYPRDHPRIELLRRKGLMAWTEWPTARWMHDRRARGQGAGRVHRRRPAVRLARPQRRGQHPATRRPPPLRTGRAGTSGTMRP